jgi:hypothetical protein
MRPPPQHTRWYALVGNGHEESRRPHGMRLPPFHTVRVINGSRVLPLTRAWHSLANGIRSAIPLNRPVGGYGDVSRPQRDKTASLCTRHCHGERASLSVWCSHVLAAPVSRNHVRTCDRLSTAPGPGTREKSKKTARRGSVSLDNRGPSMWPLLSSPFYGLPRLMRSWSLWKARRDRIPRHALVAS